MLLMKFPNNKFAIQKRKNALEDYKENKKLKNALRNNFIAVGIIFALGIYVNVLIARIILLFLAVLLLAMNLMLYKLGTKKYSEKIITEIYENKIVNSQYNLLGSAILRYEFSYENVTKTEQTAFGGLAFYLKNKEDIQITSIKKNGIETKITNEKEKIVLNFFDLECKYFMINNLYEQIGYDKKVYNIIEDDEEDSDF